MMYLFIALTGLLNAIQAGCNSTLQRSLEHPIVSALVSFATGSLALVVALTIYTIVTRQPMPGSQHWSAAPWWAWIGGTLGAIYILCMVLAAQKVGSGTFMGITISASILASIAIDHYGLLGFTRHTAGPARLIGGGLMVAGILLIAKF